MFNDLRDFINRAAEMGDVKNVAGAEWDLEIGALTDITAERPDAPLLVFDEIKGYPAGFRVATNLFTTERRTALGLDLPLDAGGIDLVRALRQRLKDAAQQVPPETVKDGPVKENVITGDDVDLGVFPTPRWHELDGGRYIGTGSACVTRDPDEGWVNVGTYRIQIHDRNTVTASLVPGHHGQIIAQKYWDRGQACPIAIACGQEPLLWAASHWEGIPWGISEYDYAGGLKGQPLLVTPGVTTDLPIPATAEIVLEGEILPPEVETREEGPFGEWAGYYAGGVRSMAAIRIKSILHRNDPIIQGNPPSRLPSVWTLGRHLHKAASLWEELERNLPGIRGVWIMREASIHSIPVISLKQTYAGHARAAAMLALGSSATGFFASMVIVVDEDIDPANTSEVIWALGTRVDPEISIQIISGLQAGGSTPMLSPEKKRLGQFSLGRTVILACKPYSWIKDFPPTTGTSPELAARMRAKWTELLG